MHDRSYRERLSNSMHTPTQRSPRQQVTFVDHLNHSPTRPAQLFDVGLDDPSNHALEPKKRVTAMGSPCRAWLLVSLVSAWAAAGHLQAIAQVPVDVLGALPIDEYNLYISSATYNEWG